MAIENGNSLRFHEQLALTAGRGELGNAARRHAGRVVMGVITSPVRAWRGVNAMRVHHEAGQIMTARNVEFATALQDAGELAQSRRDIRHRNWADVGRAGLGAVEGLGVVAAAIPVGLVRGLGLLVRAAERGAHYVADAGKWVGDREADLAHAAKANLDAASAHDEAISQMLATHNARYDELHGITHEDVARVEPPEENVA